MKYTEPHLQEIVLGAKILNESDPNRVCGNCCFKEKCTEKPGNQSGCEDWVEEEK